MYAYFTKMLIILLLSTPGFPFTAKPVRICKSGQKGIPLQFSPFQNDRKRGNPLFSFFKHAPQTDEDYQNLLDNLAETMDSLHLAYENFENATDPELIDSYIYEVNAIQMRYKFLLCRLKSYEMTEPEHI